MTTEDTQFASIAIGSREEGIAISMRIQLEEICERGWVYPKNGDVVYESIIERKYPGVNIPLLCDLLADSLFDWHATIREYLDRHGATS